MSNSLLNISMITKESLRQLKNQLGFSRGVNRQYDDQFAKSGAKIGSVINIRKPVRFKANSGAALVMQDVADQYSALTLDTQQHVGFQFSSKELTLNIDEFSKRYIVPAMTALANKVDSDGTLQYKNVWNYVGAPGSVPTTALLYLQAGQLLDESGAPVDGLRNMLVNPAAQANAVDALKGLFQSSEKIAEQYEKGMMGEGLGFKWKMSQNIQSHQTGTFGGTPLMNGATVDGASTVVTDGWNSGASSLKKGDCFTIDNVYAVNPQTRLSTGALQKFVVTADISDTSGAMTIAISPTIHSSGNYQNVDSLPADEAAIKVFSAVSTYSNKQSPANLAYHRDAFVLGCADLELPGGIDMAARATDPDSGLSIRIVRQYDINNDTFPCRADILYGWQTVYPELAVRVQG